MYIAILCKVKDIFMTVIEEPVAHYRLEVTDCNVTGNVWVVTNFSLAYCYRFDPVDDVLQNKVLSQNICYIPCYPRVLWLVSYVRKKEPSSVRACLIAMPTSSIHVRYFSRGSSSLYEL